MTDKRERIHILTEGAVMVALATVLSFITIWDSPYGGSVTLVSMLPIILFALRRGVGPGLLAGFVHSLIQLLQGLSNVAYVPTPLGIFLCVVLDYLLPFTMLGLAGLFKGVKLVQKDATVNTCVVAVLAALLVTVLRFGCHLISGVVIWRELDLEWYADDPTHIVNVYGPWMFSLIYNGLYMVPEIIATTVAAAPLAAALKQVKV